MERIEARKLRERIALEKRQTANPDAPNDYGNTVSSFVAQGEVHAEFRHLRGGEAVMAGRLQGRHPVVMRVRASALTRSLAADWRVTDVRTGTVYAIRDVTVYPGGQVVDILAESGVAA